MFFNDKGYIVKYAGNKEHHEFSSACWPRAVQVARTVER
jgi:hypothetical protein